MILCATLFGVGPGAGLECPVLVVEGLDVLDRFTEPRWMTQLDRAP